MNKKILCLAFLGFINFNINAQSNPRNPIVTGVKAGFSLTNISAGNNSQEMKPGFHGGGFIELPLTYYKQFSLQFELMYSNQGYKGKEYEIRDEVTGKVVETNKLSNVTLHYLNVPILFKYYPSENFSIELGPQIGFLMDASGEYDLYKYNPSKEFLNPYFNGGIDQALYEAGYRSSNYRDYYEKLDYGIAAGISYNFEGGFFISGKYYLGLQDIYKADNDFQKIPIPPGTPDFLVNQINKINSELDFKKATNSVIQISLGYRF